MHVYIYIHKLFTHQSLSLHKIFMYINYSHIPKFICTYTGTPPKMGKWGSLPMNGQVSCEGPKGKTSLNEPAPGPGAFFRYTYMDFFTCIYTWKYIFICYICVQMCTHTYIWTCIPFYS
jgi:hypothetical protein